MAKLPPEVQPLSLLKQFPRLANVLARAWLDPVERQQVLEELLVDRRGGRTGFPAEVTEELLVLRDHCQGRYANLPASAERALQQRPGNP